MIDTINLDCMDGLLMIDTVNLDCKIYVNTDMSHSELVQSIAQFLSGTVKLSTIYLPRVEIDVAKNDDYDEVICKKFPDGFLYFRYFVELYAFPEQQMQNQIELVSKILTYFWSENIPAVAASDYENDLPNNGGYKSSLIPWVS